MRTQNIGFNPYIKIEQSYANKAKTQFLSNQNVQKDSYNFSTENDKSTIIKEYKTIKAQQGIIGKTWDGIKNLFGSKSGSKALEDTIKQYNQGKISEDEEKQAIEKYKEGQNTCVDVVADMASGILAVGAFALAVPTGGASLAVGLGMATAVGAGVKV